MSGPISVLVIDDQWMIREGLASLAALAEDIEVVTVRELGEVLALALRDARFQDGRLLFGDEKPEDVMPLSAEALSGGIEN